MNSLIQNEVREKIQYWLTNDPKRAEEEIMNLFSSSLEKVEEDLIKEVRIYRNERLTDEEEKEGKGNWYEKNYWCNRVIDKLKSYSEKAV